MSDPEIIALREVIAKRVRSDDIAQRRRDIDARGLAYKLPADVTVEPVTANGVKSEWTSTPDADRGKAVLYLHGGGYVIGSLDSHRHLVAEMRPRGAGAHAGDRLSACAGASVPGRGGRCARRLSLPAGERRAAGRHHHRRRFRRRRARGRGDAGDPRRRIAAARVRLGDLAMGRHGGDRRQHDQQGRNGSRPCRRPASSTWRSTISNGADPRSPLAAPIYADLRGLAPLLIQVGAAETLLDDAIRLAQVAGAADVAVDLQIWPEMIHVWHIYHPRACGRTARHRRGRRIRTRHDIAWIAQRLLIAPILGFATVLAFCARMQHRLVNVSRL